MNFTLILIIGAALVFILLLIGLIATISSDRASMQQRLESVVEEELPRGAAGRERATPLTDWINQRVAGSSMGAGIARELARADLKFKPGEYIATMFVAAFGVAFIAYFLGGQSILFAIIGGVLGFFIPRFYVKREQGKRLMRFNNQLGDMLNLMVNSLRAGYSTTQAMDAVSKELPSPICDEFRRVGQEMQLGVSMEAALENILRRIPSDDLDLVITAVNVQREVGGNLADILDTISFTIRERVRVKGEIRVLTAQVMYSGRFLSMLPLILLAMLYVMNKEYMMEFFKPESAPCGYIALGVAGLLIIGGYFAMNKLADIEV
jgi:tight adherence protein B